MLEMSSKSRRQFGEVSPEVARQIDENLKHLYLKDTSEELPQSLLDLLEALRAQDAQPKTGDQ